MNRSPLDQKKVAWFFLVSFSWLVFISSPAYCQPSRSLSDITVIASGVGRNEAEATSAALREAIARSVGTWVESDLVVKNNRVVRDDLREHSSGFIRTYRLLASERATDDRVRITIRAKVERTDVQQPIRATRTVFNVDPDLLDAEALTLATARRSATKLLASLLTDLPKLVKVELPSKSAFTRTKEGIKLTIRISVDEELYVRWGMRAVALLDRIAVAKDSVVVDSVRLGPVDWQIPEPFRDALLVHRRWTNPPPGFAIGILTDRDQGWRRTKWRRFWVDAERLESLTPLVGTPQLHLEAHDLQGNVLAKEEVPIWSGKSNGKPIDNASSNGGWLLFHVDGRNENKQQIIVNLGSAAALFIGPIASTLTMDESVTGGRMSPVLVRQISLKMSEQQYRQVSEIVATVRWE